ncbi:MAG: glycosyltransferase family 25 protein [Acidimicrobiales bacterium]
MRAYVVNLARSAERRRHIARELARTGMQWELVEAVDARQADIDQPSIVAPGMKAHPLFRPGAAGCALSHLRVYERVLSSGDERAVVLEDDVLLPEDFSALADAVAANMEGAEVALLNFHHPDGLKLASESAVALEGPSVLASPVNIEGLTSGAAYVVTRQACAGLVETMLPMRFFSDEWWQLVRSRALERVRCVAPMPVRQSLEFATTIDHYAPGSWQWLLREACSHAGLYRLPLLRKAVEQRRRVDFEKWGALGDVQLVGNGLPEPAVPVLATLSSNA